MALKGVRLTKTKIQELEYGGRKCRGGGYTRFIVWDTDVQGLGIRVFPTRRRAWVFSYRAGRQSRLITLGDFPALTVKMARDQATSLRASIRLEGHDPLAERRSVRSLPTIEKLCADYLANHAKPHKRTWAKDEQRINRHVLSKWRTRTVESITRTDVAALHRSIGAKAPYEANRTLSLLQKVFEYAKDYEYLADDDPNPAHRIKRYKEDSRDRRLTQAEIPLLWKAIDEEPNDYIRAYFKLLLLTGARKSELLSAKRKDINWDGKELRLPETKSGRIQYLLLPDAALHILDGLPTRMDNLHVFCGARTGRPMVNVDDAWYRIRERAGLDDLRIHDLRRTVGSMMGDRNVSAFVIRDVLRHADLTPTETYVRPQEDSGRKALETHAVEILSLVG